MSNEFLLRLLVTLSSFLVVFLQDISSQEAFAAQRNEKPLKVGFVLVGPVTDWGWNYAHNQGRLFMESSMGKEVVTTMAEKIPESAEAERVLEKMLAAGNKLIFTTSYGYLEPVLRIAARHPDVVFMQVNRVKTTKNVGTYLSQQYQPLYLAGIVAGRMTKTNKLGFVGPHPVPPGLQNINSFTLGARSVNPKIKTHVVWINSWSDPPTEAEAVRGLAETGIDVVAHMQDNQNTITKTAENLGIYVVGHYTDARKLAPRAWLTGPCLDWGPLYVKIARSVMDNTWKTSCINSGMGGGYVKLASFGVAVPKAVRQEALAVKEKIEKGHFVIFKGPLKDRNGKEHLAEGQTADAAWLANMDFFVEGVEGTLPKK